MEFVVRKCNLARVVPVFVAAFVLWSSASAAPIDADRKKEYKLTKRHGPWMIMVASFKEPPSVRRTKGMTPEQAAHELVFELRKAGIPAYTFSHEEAAELLASQITEKNIKTYDYSKDEIRAQVETVDLQGRARKREYSASQKTYSVLAGNYDSSDETTKGGKLAKDTLAWIEDRFQPEFLTAPDPDFEESRGAEKSSVRKLKSGGILRLTPGKLRQGDGPLAGAFLTLNPLLSPEEAQSKKQDPLLIKLNSGGDLSLYNNQGKYTLVVASFYGKASKAQVGMMGLANFREAQASFTPGESLDLAAQEAWNLATLIRQGYFVMNEYKFVKNSETEPGHWEVDTTKPARPQAFEAWIWHDRFKSVVTIGSFDNLNDPRIVQLQTAFGAKIKEHAQTRRPFLAAEQLTIPAVLKANQLPEKAWIFDPKPQLVEVPTLQ
jgi:hypothetical protein